MMPGDGPSLRQAGDLLPRADPGHDPQLAAIIRAEIRSAGPMTFARFMDLALYHPGLGYYATGQQGPGRTSDFLTAPEAHPIFGWSVARQLEEIWERLGRPERFTVREHGAGTGALAAGIVEGLSRSGSPLRAAIRYRIVERGAERLAQVRERLARHGAADVLEPDDGEPVSGAVLANEVLDAVPVHRVEADLEGRLRELLVDVDDSDAFVTAIGELSVPDIAIRLEREGIVLAPGQRAEVCLALDDWVQGAAGGLLRGLLVLIDYGHPATALYEAQRGSLLRAYLHHRVHDNPFVNVGRQDLSAHVDLTAVEHAAAAAGLRHLGTTTQAEFLTGVGAGDLLVALQDDPKTELADYLSARSALIRMIDPAATGRFATMIFSRDLPPGPPLRGLSFRLPRRA